MATERPVTPAGMRGSSALQVAPSAVEFAAFEPGACYVAALAVRNTGPRPLRFRLEPPPRASPFRVRARGGRDLATSANPSVQLPPGLSAAFEVAFDAGEREDPIFHDALVLTAEDRSRLEVPLLARRACPALDVEPSLCDLGLVVLAQRSAQVVRVRNAGARPGVLRVEVLGATADNAVTVTPLRGSLAPNEALNVKVEAVGTALGAFRAVVRLRVRERSPDESEDGESEAPADFSGGRAAYQAEKLVDVCGRVVEHNVELVLAHGLALVKSLHFGSLFAGERRTIETVLRNNGPLPLLFKTTLTFGGGAGAGGAAGGGGGAGGGDDDREAYERRKELQVSPTEGRVEPFAQHSVTFTYHPRAVDALRLKQLEAKRRESLGEQSQSSHESENGGDDDPGSALPLPPIALNAFASVQCVDLQAQNLTFEVSGRAFLPKVALSPSSVLDFGDVKSHDRVDLLVSLKNLSGLPVYFAVPKIAHFAVKPESGRLDVLQSQSLVASFTPTQLGAFQSSLRLAINTDVLVLLIRVQGRATAVGDATSRAIVGGPRALPSDFAPQYKFLLPDEAKRTKGKLTHPFTRVAPYEAAALNGTAAVDEYEFAGTNSTHLTYCVKELARRADHNAGYHAYLAACRAQRDERQQQHKRSATAVKREVSSARRRRSHTDGDNAANDGDVDLGMEPQSGVQPRAIRLPPELKQRSDPLWRCPAGGGGGSSGGPSKAKALFDENKLVKKKFKAQPATQAEIADCALPLDFDELEQVLAGPKTLHFGKLSVNSAATKSLSVQNNLARNIHVALHLREDDRLDELAARTALKAQVVPPHSLAGFDLVFCSASEQFFQKQLGLSINGVHKREVTVVADVAPIVVELSARELQFEFSYLDTSPSTTLDVALTNTSDSVAPFQWTLASSSARPDSSKSNATAATTVEKQSLSAATASGSARPIFEVLPSSGALSPGASFVCQVVYTPPGTGSSSYPSHSVSADRAGRGSWVEQAFVLDIAGGKQSALACKALVHESRVAAKEKKVDFGTVSVGIEREKKVTLSNAASDAASSSGSSWAAFYASVEPAAMVASLGLSVTPTVGTIQVDDSVEVVVKMYPHKQGVLDSSVALHVQVRGGKSVKIPIAATVLVPEVFVSPPSDIAFGDVVLGVSVPRLVSLENRSCITASLVLDLGAALSDEFAVVMPPKLLARLEDVSSVFIPLIDAREPPSSPERSDATVLPTGDAAELDTVCSRWQICIPANTTVSFHLAFTPKRSGSYSHVLPVQIAGVSGAIARPASLTRTISAAAVLPRLLFSSAVLDFHRCVITREGIRKVPYTKFLTLTNRDSKSVKWQVDVAQLKQPQPSAANPAASKRAGHTMSASASAAIFHLAPDKGELAPGEDVKIRVSFLPLEAVEYAEEEIPLRLDDQFYIHLSVRGEGIHPHLSFSENKVLLPTVPLGVCARARVVIQSTGYDHLDLTYRIPLDLAKAPVSLHFPRGKILSIACPKLPVEVRFCSKKSVAFNARIEFFDADGNVFDLPVAGCAENCVLTNHAFLEAHDSDDIESADGLGSPQPPHHQRFRYFSHPSMRFPIYLLPRQQYDAEVRKAEELADQPAAHPQASGLVDVDSAATLDDEPDFSSSSASLLLLGVGGGLGAGAAAVAPPLPPPQFSEREIAFLLQYLNTNFLRSPVTRFPHDFADVCGKPLYELLEMVCAKKPSGGGAMPALKATKAGAPGPSKKDLLAHYAQQYSELLKFLKSYGAMLQDVAPEHLLAQEFYVRACEDPRADPAIFSAPGLVGMRFLPRRHALEREWLAVSATAWMKVLYQVVKCFLLYRITAKGYAAQQHTLRQRQSRAEVLPRGCQGSNVYSEAEMVLLQWVCDNVKAHAPQDPAVAEPVEARLLDVRRDLLDGRLLFHLVASHIPTLSTEQNEYQCFRLDLAARRPLSHAQLQSNAQLLLQTLAAFGVDFGIDPDAFLLPMNAREMVVLLLHLHQTLPQFIPKATIEFKGVLGQPIEKSIELKNPSARALRYQVFLDGADAGSCGGSSGGCAFSIESNSVVLEPGKTEAFVVTFRPRFSRKVTARLVFQSVREHASLAAPSGATMVFILESNVVARRPVRVVQIETHTYEKRTEELVIENQFPALGAYRISMTQQPLHQSSTSAFAAPPGGPSSMGAQQASSVGLLRRRSVQAKDKDALPPNPAGDAAQAGSKKSLHASRSRDESDFTWCMCAQQPFFLPEFGSSGTAAAATSGDLGLQPSAAAGLGVVTIRSQASVAVKLEFLPLLPGAYKCQLLFLDEKIGEFMYEVHAVAHLPASLDSLRFQCETAAGAPTGGGTSRHSFLRELVVPVKNPALSRALAGFVDRASGHLKAKLKEGLKRCEDTHHSTFLAELNSPFFASVHADLVLSSAQSAMRVPRANSTAAVGGDSELQTSRTDPSGSDLAAVASTPSASKGGAAKANQARLLTPRSNNTAAAAPNTVLLDFRPKGAGVYTCKLLLRSRHTVCGSSDLRVYDLEAKVKEPNVKTLLEFAAPARHSIVQEIPLSNPSDAAWTLRASFGNSNSSSAGGVPSMFSGPPALVVPAKKSASYPLTFAPQWISTERSSFALVNPATQQQFEFELRGVGEEPLAQDHVVIACQARTSVAREFAVVSFKTDPPGAQTFKVESDLRDVKGAPSLTVPAGGGAAATYELTFSPIVSGTYFGSITFTNEATGEYIWYTIEANVSPPEPEATLAMRAAVRGAVGVEISLANPLDHAVAFAIELQGEGLLGAAAFALEAHASGVYELVYSPMQVTGDARDGGADPGDGAVLFSNDEIGQFWYRLQLSATRAPAHEMADMCCAVGDVCAQPILLQNPSDRDLSLQYRVSNTRNFSIKGGTSSAGRPARVAVPPFGHATVVVEYTPSSLSEPEAASITFFEPDVVSDWEFTVKGVGKAPSVMKPIVVAAKVHEAASMLFTFKNPFADTLRVDVKLVVDDAHESPMSRRRGGGGAGAGDSSQGVFDVLLKKSRVLMESFGHLQVPISFLPRCVCEARAEIVIRGSEEYGELEWRYPIRGVAEAPLFPRPFTLACQARDSVEKMIVCELLAAPAGMAPADETFAVAWDVPAERFGALATAASVERALTIRALPAESSSSSAGPGASSVLLPYHVRFDPLRPYRGSVYLLVKKASGGLWRFEVALDTSEPPVDDAITIESNLNQTSSVTFQLRNQFRQSARFLAEFSAGSSSAFTVFPAEGFLPPFGSDDGQSFVVSFTPTGYGKMQSGQLVILTEEMQWTFNIKGAYPDASGKSSGPGSSLGSSTSRYRLGITSPSPAVESPQSRASVAMMAISEAKFAVEHQRLNDVVSFAGFVAHTHANTFNEDLDLSILDGFLWLLVKLAVYYVADLSMVSKHLARLKSATAAVSGPQSQLNHAHLANSASSHDPLRSAYRREALEKVVTNPMRARSLVRATRSM
ncbi:hypothetical protein PybrP1_012273 [[Pythium] brassicae (nom. inval.)]|nr:hypothetical protein PybrP1_012273 [[Pythium] brassicae (nom. inval.)]